MDINTIIIMMVLSGMVPAETRRPGAWDRSVKTREYRRANTEFSMRHHDWTFDGDCGEPKRRFKDTLPMWDGYEDAMLRGDEVDARNMYLDEDERIGCRAGDCFNVPFSRCITCSGGIV